MWSFLWKETLFVQKKVKKVSCQICDNWFHKQRTQLPRKDFKLLRFKKFNSLCHSCFGKRIPFFPVNISPKNNQNLKAYYHMSIIITPRSNKTNCNSIDIETPFDYSKHPTFNNSKSHDFINESITLNNKAN